MLIRDSKVENGRSTWAYGMYDAYLALPIIHCTRGTERVIRRCRTLRGRLALLLRRARTVHQWILSVGRVEPISIGKKKPH